MIKNLYALRDEKVGFLGVLNDENDDIAKRNFGAAVLSGQGLYGEYPEDFSLYSVGTFDTESGEVRSTGVRIIATGAQFRKEFDREVLNKEEGE